MDCGSYSAVHVVAAVAVASAAPSGAVPVAMEDAPGGSEAVSHSETDAQSEPSVVGIDANSPHLAECGWHSGFHGQHGMLHDVVSMKELPNERPLLHRQLSTVVDSEHCVAVADGGVLGPVAETLGIAVAVSSGAVEWPGVPAIVASEWERPH